jgi:hypothetical protein
MNIDLTLKYLRNQLKTIDTDSLESWILTTSGYAEQYFGSHHNRVYALKQLRFAIVKLDLLKTDKKELDDVKSKAIQYVNEFIDDLQDLKKQQEEKPKIKYPFGLSKEFFWGVLLTIIGAAYTLGFNFGSYKFDRDKIELSDTNRALTDTIRIRENKIKYIRHNSDSALNILAHMPYDEMKLDTLSWRKVQTTIENAGAALNLNK